MQPVARETKRLIIIFYRDGQYNNSPFGETIYYQIINGTYVYYSSPSDIPAEFSDIPLETAYILKK